MDKSEQYIRMCEEAAEELQKRWKPIDGDFCWHDNEGAEYLGSHEFPATNAVVHLAMGNTRDYWYNWLWLPRQDQLQEMVEENNPVSLIRDLEEWTSLPMWIQLKPSRKATPLAEEFYTSLNRLTSMEQLWLAFVMKEKHNKVWAGDSWKATTI